jgi:uncharacterized protein YfaT (DUF1175 family)
VSRNRGIAASEQAEKFLAWFVRLGAADRAGAFRRWTRSKDLGRRDRAAIAREVGRILAQRGRP